MIKKEILVACCDCGCVFNSTATEDDICPVCKSTNYDSIEW